MRKPIIIGNWKMNKTYEEAQSLTAGILTGINDLEKANEKVEMVICPPFISLAKACEMCKNTDLKVGAQNLYPVKSGAFTGEISPLMLSSLGATYVVLGHSERREYFNESNEFVAEKVKTALEYNLIPVVCVGESLELREAGNYLQFIGEEVEKSLASIDKNADIIIAYEPIWAIGTGKTASSEDAEEVIGFIRNKINEIFGEDFANRTRILYGGSVKSANIKELLACENIDGGLVGGASLEAEEFVKIISNSLQ